MSKLLICGLFQKGRVLAQDAVAKLLDALKTPVKVVTAFALDMVTTRPPKTIAEPTALGPVANTDTKLLIYGLFQKGRVLAQDGVQTRQAHSPSRMSATACLLSAIVGAQVRRRAIPA